MFGDPNYGSFFIPLPSDLDVPYQNDYLTMKNGYGQGFFAAYNIHYHALFVKNTTRHMYPKTPLFLQKTVFVRGSIDFIPTSIAEIISLMCPSKNFLKNTVNPFNLPNTILRY
jgi:hypothetical protein